MINKRECIELAFRMGYKVEFFDMFWEPGELIVLGAAGSRDMSGLDALMQASFLGKHEVVELLLKMGVKPDNKSNRGETALSIATKRNHDKVVNLINKYMEKSY